MRTFIICIFSIALFACSPKKNITIKGNWGFYQNNPEQRICYNEVYINDSTLIEYTEWLGFMPPLIYKINNYNELLLYDSEQNLVKRGIIKKVSHKKRKIYLFSLEGKDTIIYNLKKLSDTINYNPQSKNIDEYYEWLNKNFIPAFNKRK